MKPIIKVMPDYTSTGLWHNQHNVNFEGLGIKVPPELEALLEYWHAYWEMCQMFDHGKFLSTMTDDGFNIWKSHGETLADSLNKCQDRYEFVLDVDHSFVRLK